MVSSAAAAPQLVAGVGWIRDSLLSEAGADSAEIDGALTSKSCRAADSCHSGRVAVIPASIFNLIRPNKNLGQGRGLASLENFRGAYAGIFASSSFGSRST